MVHIKKYEKGLPCTLGATLGRIVGESDHSQPTQLNGIEVQSHPQFCTPYGTLIEVGVKYLGEISKSGLKQLRLYEADAKKSGPLYRGLLDPPPPPNNQ